MKQLKIKPLFQICLNFIRDNLECLESLVDFPESIGKQIFAVAYHPDRTDMNKPPYLTYADVDFRNTLQVFFEAYGVTGILHSLSLKSDPFFLSDTVDDCWWLYRSLTRLDLAYCGLGDDHDILPQLLLAIDRLQTLILKGNLLTDEGTRKLTVRTRMYKERILPLQIIDLSKNYGVTVKSLDFLKCLSKLAVVDVSSTSISRKVLATGHFSTQLETLSVDCESDAPCRCIRSSLAVVTSGWGSEVVEVWKHQCDEARQRKALARVCGRARLGAASGAGRNAHSFYSRNGMAHKFKNLEGSSAPVIPKTNDKKLVLVSSARFTCSCANSFRAEISKSQSQKKHQPSSALASSNSSKLHDSPQKVSSGSAGKHETKWKKEVDKHEVSCSCDCVRSDSSRKKHKKLHPSSANDSIYSIGCRCSCKSPRSHEDLPQSSSVKNRPEDLQRKRKAEEDIDSLITEYSQGDLSSSSPLGDSKPRKSLLDVLGEYM